MNSKVKLINLKCIVNVIKITHCLKLTKTLHIDRKIHLQSDYRLYIYCIYSYINVQFLTIFHVNTVYSIKVDRKWDRNSKDVTDRTYSLSFVWFIILLFQINLEILQFHYLGFVFFSLASRPSVAAYQVVNRRTTTMGQRRFSCVEEVGCIKLA